MQVTQLPLSGLLLIKPQVFKDDRGWFMEPWNRERFAALGITLDFAQDNHSRSAGRTLRGLHFQTQPGQAKLVRCTRGSIWDVAVDIRLESPTFGKWHAEILDEENQHSMLIPIGFAHGFCVLSELAEVQYKCSNVYNAATESGIAWNDPDIAIQWPIAEPLLSKRDVSNKSLADYQRAASLSK